MVAERSKPNWGAFHQRMKRTAPTMLKGVPEDLMWWVTEFSEEEDWFLPGVQEMLVGLWGETRQERERAIIVALERFTNNVIVRLGEEVEYAGDYPPKELKRILARVEKITLKPRRDEIEALLARALSSEQIDPTEEFESSRASGMSPGTTAEESVSSPPVELPPQQEIPVERLPFELLPPGSGETEPIVEYYRREMTSLSLSLRKRQLDESRLTMIMSLKPSKCYIGTERWKGYVLFEFEETAKVVLECPIEDNATYVLSGDWRPMIRQTKRDLRGKHADRCVRIVHTDSWLDRVRQALF
jgi:hypothetical protein